MAAAAAAAGGAGTAECPLCSADRVAVCRVYLPTLARHRCPRHVVVGRSRPAVQYFMSIAYVHVCIRTRRKRSDTHRLPSAAWHTWQRNARERVIGLLFVDTRESCSASVSNLPFDTGCWAGRKLAINVVYH